MMERDRSMRRVSMYSVLPKILCHLTIYIETILLILRGYLHVNKHLNFRVVIPSIQFQSTAIDLTVFSIGFCLLFLCLLSLLSLVRIITTLGVKRVKNFLLRPRDIQLRVRWLVCVLCLLPCSSMYSVWLFFFVREQWSSSFAEPVQFLHLVPTGVFLLHTIAEVLTLICAYALTDSRYKRSEWEDVITHVRMVESVNYVFIIYCASIFFIVHHDGLNASTAFVKATILFELSFRLVFILFAHHLEDKIKRIHVQPQIAQDDATIPQIAQDDATIPQIAQDDATIPQIAQDDAIIPQIAQDDATISQIAQDNAIIPQIAQDNAWVAIDFIIPFYASYEPDYSKPLVY